MAFDLPVQQAPVRRGIVGDPSAWSGGGGSDPTPTQHGYYTGELNKTYTFTVTVQGTVGTIAVLTLTWDDGEGNTGQLNVGTSAGYAIDDVVYVHDGWSISFGSGVLNLSATFTVSVTARNLLHGLSRVSFGGTTTTQTNLTGWRMDQLDDLAVTQDGRTHRVRRRSPRSVSAVLDYADASSFDQMLWAESERLPLTIAENYGARTRFLLRGGGLMPLVGSRPVFTRAGTATYQDWRTGLWRSVAANEPRIADGVGGRSIVMDGGGTTNVLAQFHPKSGALGWSTGAGATLAFSTNDRGVLDPDDDHWGDEYTEGVMTAEMGASGEWFSTSTATIPATGVTWTGSVYLKGRGSVVVTIRTAGTIRGAAVVGLTNDWQRVEVSGPAGGGDTTADIRIDSAEDQVYCVVSAAQIEAGFFATALVKTDGASASRSGETLQLVPGIPFGETTMGFWIRWPGGSGSNTYTLVSGGSAAFQFRFWYDETGSPDLAMTTVAGGSLTAAQTLVADTWYHLAFQIKRSGAANEVTREIWVNGSSIGSDTINVYAPTTPYDDIYIGQNESQASELTLHDARFEEIRIDESPLDSDAIAAQYNRLNDDEWLHVHREFGGRYFLMGGLSRRWLDGGANVDKIMPSVDLLEEDREDDAVVIP